MHICCTTVHVCIHSCKRTRVCVCVSRVLRVCVRACVCVFVYARMCVCVHVLRACVYICVACVRMCRVCCARILIIILRVCIRTQPPRLRYCLHMHCIVTLPHTHCRQSRARTHIRTHARSAAGSAACARTYMYEYTRALDQCIAAARPHEVLVLPAQLRSRASSSVIMHMTHTQRRQNQVRSRDHQSPT